MHQIDRNTGDIDRKQSAPAELIYAHKQCRRVHDPAVDHHRADCPEDRERQPRRPQRPVVEADAAEEADQADPDRMQRARAIGDLAVEDDIGLHEGAVGPGAGGANCLPDRCYGCDWCEKWVEIQS